MVGSPADRAVPGDRDLLGDAVEISERILGHFLRHGAHEFLLCEYFDGDPRDPAVVRALFLLSLEDLAVVLDGRAEFWRGGTITDDTWVRLTRRGQRLIRQRSGGLGSDAATGGG